MAAGHDFSLNQEALDARVDQARAECGQYVDADGEREQSREVEEDDAAGEARKALRNEELPGARHPADDVGSLLVCTGGASTGVSPSVSGSS